MTKLTESNYYTPKNRYLTNSKLGDWLICKQYFYEKHITGSRVDEPTDAQLVGKAVDVWLTQSRKKFERQFIKVKRRGGGSPDWVTPLTETQYDEVVGICEAVEATSAYKDIKKRKFKKQQILQVDKKIGMFEGLAGIPDWIHVEADTCEIVDLKTSRTAHPVKYYYHALEYGYFRQQAMYQMLAGMIFGAREFRSMHLVVEKDSKKIYKVKTFVLSQGIIEKEKKNIEHILGEISREKSFKKEDASWAGAEILGKDISLSAEDAAANWTEV